MQKKKKKYLFWTDKLAKDIVEMKRFRYLPKKVPKFKKFVVKSAASVSGVLHIGRLSDTIRGEAVHRSLVDAGFKSDFIWTADNVDPLRKIPKGVPENYKQYIGVPVTEIPDWEGCHKTYEQHFKSAYLEVVNQFIQSKMKTFSMREEYLKGHFKKEIKIILDNHEKVVAINNANRPKDNPLKKDWSPWQPICENCGKIITARVTKIEKGKVHYVCKDYQFKTQTAVGCNHEGINDPVKGNGKLVYKSELAAQHYHWQVRSEGFGKEYIVPGSAFWINMEILEKVLDFPSSIPIFYEHLVIDGKKMSASLGNVVYPKNWVEVSTPELLRLLFLKDPMRERNFRWIDIPRMFDEFDTLQKIYYGKQKVESERDRITHKRLFELIHISKIPRKFSPSTSFSSMVELIRMYPDVSKRKNIDKTRLNYVKSWYEKYGRKYEQRIEKVEVLDSFKPAIQELISVIEKEKDGEKLQKDIFLIAKKHSLKPPEFFRTIYMILLKTERGPRLGPYIIERGKSEIIEKLEEVL